MVVKRGEDQETKKICLEVLFDTELIEKFTGYVYDFLKLVFANQTLLSFSDTQDLVIKK